MVVAIRIMGKGIRRYLLVRLYISAQVLLLLLLLLLLRVEMQEILPTLQYRCGEFFNLYNSLVLLFVAWAFCRKSVGIF